MRTYWQMTLKIGLAAVALMMTLSTASCDGPGIGDRGGDKVETMAKYIQDGVPNYNDEQKQCPICGAPGLHADQFVDVEGKRIYFDKKECVQKFKENQSAYLSKVSGGGDDDGGAKSKGPVRGGP